MIDELTEDSPRAPQPAGIRTALFPHQLALLHQALAFEDAPRTTDNSACARAYFGAFPRPERYSFRPRIGILGDKAGAGKSLVALALVALRGTVPAPPDVVGFSDVNLLALTHSDFTTLDTNVIVVPHTLFAQWTEYLSQTDLSHAGINTRRALDGFDFAAPPPAVVLVSATCFREFATTMRHEFGLHVRVSRIFFDEFDTINADGSELRAGFTWLIASAYRAVLDPMGRRRDGYRDAMDVLRGRSFLHRIIRACDLSVPSQLMASMVVKNSDAFVDRSLMVPAPRHEVIACKDPHAVTVLRGLVSPTVIDLLNAGEVEAAMDELGLRRVSNEPDLLRAVTRHLQQTAHNLQMSLDAAHSTAFDSDDERLTFMQPTQVLLDEARHRIAAITQRMGDEHVCCVCFERPTPRTVIKCCSNSYCFGCIVEWVRRQNSCPTCKCDNITRDMLVVLSPGAATVGEGRDATVTMLGCFPFSNSKLKNLRILLEALASLPDRRIILFSSYDSSFTAVLPVLIDIQLSFAVIKGTAGRVARCVSMFNRGDVRLLLMNTACAGAGINLPAATDVIMFQRFNSEAKKQIIGRAQRPGRTEPLNVHYLLHENEL